MVSTSRLVRRHRFAGQRGFIAFQACAFNQPAVRRHQIAGLQLDDVARYQIGRFHHRFYAAADRFCRGGAHVFQRCQRGFCLALLNYPQYPVDHHDHEDDNRFNPVRFTAGQRMVYTQSKGYQRRNDQNDHHDILHLVEKTQDEAARRLFPKLVCTVLLPSVLQGFFGQAAFRIGFQLLTYLIQRFAVPDHCLCLLSAKLRMFFTYLFISIAKPDRKSKKS